PGQTVPPGQPLTPAPQTGIAPPPAAPPAPAVQDAQLPPVPNAPVAGSDSAFARIPVPTGRSHVLTTDFDVTRIAITNPAVADALVVMPREILIDGKSPGTVSLVLWGTNRRVQYDVVVVPGVSVLQQQMQQIFAGEDIRVTSTDDAVVLSGHAS